MISKLGINDINFYLLTHLFIILIKDILKYLSKNYNLGKKVDNETQKSEVEILAERIESLKKEANLHDSPSEFVLHTKLTRQIAKLEKELEQKQVQEKYIQRPKTRNSPKNTYLNLFLGLETRTKVEIIFWFITIARFLLVRNKYLVIDYEHFKDNIITIFYYNKGTNQIEIPLNRVLFFETMFIVNIKNLLIQIANRYIFKNNNINKNKI